VRVERAGWVRKGKRKDQLPEAEGMKEQCGRRKGECQNGAGGIMCSKQWRRRIARNDIRKKKKRG